MDKALQRIEEIKKWPKSSDADDVLFLLRAFEVMREIAIKAHPFRNPVIADDDAKAVDEEFEKRMNSTPDKGTGL